MIRAEAHAADPRQAALDALDRGERPDVRGFAEAARLAIDDRDLLWVLDAEAVAAGGRREYESDAHRHLWGSTRLELGGRRVFPHWRSQCGWSEELLDQAKAHVGPTWDVNWHDDVGVAAARDYFAAAPRRTPPGVEHARHLDAVLERTSMGFEVPDWELPWRVAEALTRVRKQLAVLEKFYARCAKRRWQVLTGPTDL